MQTIQILDADNGTISWSISGKDRAGNQLELSSNELITGLDFDQFNQYGYEVDSTDPKIVDIRISNTNQATKYSNPNVQLVKTGDNITIEFTLSEPITQPGLSLKFGADNASGTLQAPQMRIRLTLVNPGRRFIPSNQRTTEPSITRLVGRMLLATSCSSILIR